MVDWLGETKTGLAAGAHPPFCASEVVLQMLWVLIWTADPIAPCSSKSSIVAVVRTRLTSPKKTTGKSILRGGDKRISSHSFLQVVTAWNNDSNAKHDSSPSQKPDCDLQMNLESDCKIT